MTPSKHKIKVEAEQEKQESLSVSPVCEVTHLFMPASAQHRQQWQMEFIAFLLFILL